MKIFQASCFLVLILFSFMQCSSAQKIEKKTPFNIQQSYYETWVAGVRGGGSGTNLYIQLNYNPNNIILDSVYFRRRQTKLETKPQDQSLYIGRFKNYNNLQEDLAQEDNKTIRENKDDANNFPFELKQDECIISYYENEKLKYFKISGVLKKESMVYPRVKPRNP